MTTPSPPADHDRPGIRSKVTTITLPSAPDGPILLQDHYLIEQMAQWNRERTPERPAPCQGRGAFGRFEVTNDVSRLHQGAGVPAAHHD